MFSKIKGNILEYEVLLNFNTLCKTMFLLGILNQRMPVFPDFQMIRSLVCATALPEQ